MTFSDSDLERLKEDAEGVGRLPAGKGDIRALLARLEAAEKAVKILYKNSGLQDAYVDYDRIEELYEAWRKTCGEAGK